MATLLQKKSAIKHISIATLKLFFSGCIIGFFHQYDIWLALFLALRMAMVFYKEIFSLEKKNWVLFWGMVITGICGVLAENWGIYFEFWEYHDLTNGRNFPYWLPFAWMFSFRFVYKLELKLIKSLDISSKTSKNLLALIIVAIFPALGEVITIYLGVWTYSWPYQFLGVPLYAVLCLIALHFSINIVITAICKKYNFKDIVYYTPAIKE